MLEVETTLYLVQLLLLVVAVEELGQETLEHQAVQVVVVLLIIVMEVELLRVVLEILLQHLHHKEILAELDTLLATNKLVVVAEEVVLVLQVATDLAVQQEQAVMVHHLHHLGEVLHRQVKM